MMKTKRLLILSALVLLTFSLTTAGAIAGDNDGVYAGAFLRMGVGARPLGMGGAYTGVAEGPETAYYNPGGMPFLQEPQVIASYRFLSLDRNFNYIGFARDIQPKVSAQSKEKPLNAGMALSWIYAGVNNIDGRDFSGEKIGDFAWHENAFAMSFGVSPVKYVGIGLSAKVLYTRMPNMKNDNSALSEWSFGIDLGVLVKPVPFVSLGFMIKDLNARYDWITDKVYEKDIDKMDRFPQTMRGGIGVHLPWYNTLVAFDIEADNQHDGEKYFVGVESTPFSNIVLRTGLNDGNFAGGAGFGFTVYNRPVMIQYALVTKDYDVAAEHVFSWIFQF
ncbi:hypothetical protein JW960_01220 [candidate division KSB1 bacterium]|nr:hypothetical protein [candidate division KSB1 bacterium]